jgi:hypothetical protein
MKHHHEHSSDVEPVSRKDAHKLLGIAAINAALFAFSFGMARHTKVPAFDAEGSHDVSDTLINGTRAYSAYRNSADKTWFRAFRKASYTAISGFGLYTAYKAGIDLLDAPWTIKDLHDSNTEIFGAAVIAVGNQSAYVLSNTLESSSSITTDAKRHNRLDRDVSSILAASIVVGSVLPYVTEAAGLGMGLYTAWHMRPTHDNMQHSI